MTKHEEGKQKAQALKAFTEGGEIIRPELNIEKHADFIFAPSHSKRIRAPRKKMWATELEDGQKVASYLLIEPKYGGKTPTTRTRKVYLVLVKLWEKRNKEKDILVFSAKEIADELGIKWGGKKTATEIYEELETLRATMFTWKFSFFNADGQKVDLLDHINILDRFTYVSLEDRKKSNDRFQSMHAVKFSDPILTNLQANRTKPTNIDVILNLKGELASVIYARLDIILAGRDRYERTSKGIFEDLQLAEELEYRYPAGRKRKLVCVVSELDGKPISTGILRLLLARTNDETDWKLVATKEQGLIESQCRPARLTKKQEPANSADMITLLAEDITKALGGIRGKQRLFETWALHYPADLLYQAIAEFKADVRTPSSPIQVFTAIVHRLAHRWGLDWIKPCPEPCKYRNEKN